MTASFETHNLVVQRNRQTICDDINLTVGSGEIVVLLGANGAGKTTLMDALSGVIPVASGGISLGGNRFERLPAHRRALQGLSYVEQGRTLFSRLTVEQNITLVRGKVSDFDRAVSWFPELQQRRDALAASLSGGEQQMVMVARSLVRQPKFIILDELSLGLAPIVVSRLLSVVRQVANTGVGVLLVEQYAQLALDVGDRAYVMRNGVIAASGDCAAWRSDASKYLTHLYLGEAD